MNRTLVKMGSGQSHFTDRQLEHYHKVFISIMPVLNLSQIYMLCKNDNTYHIFQYEVPLNLKKSGLYGLAKQIFIALLRQNKHNFQLIALTGSPAHSNFNVKYVLVGERVSKTVSLYPSLCMFISMHV